MVRSDGTVPVAVSLVTDERRQVLRRPGIQVILGFEDLGGFGSLETTDPAGESPYGATQLERTAGPIAVPEGHLGGGAPGAGDDDRPGPG